MDSFLGRHLLTRYLSPPVRSYFGRPFGRGAERRVLIYFNPLDISVAQVYPFIHYQRQLRERFNVSFRLLPIDHFLERRVPQTGEADIVLVEPWFDVDPERLRTGLEAQKTRRPMVPISFIDSFAANDLRLGAVILPYIEYYLKKSLFRDRTEYLRGYRRGETNLVDYYTELYNLDGVPVDWKTPPALLPKLRLSPNFLTAARFIRAFDRREPTPVVTRTIDVQTRLGIRGTPWYQAMRAHAAKAIAEVPRATTSSAARVNFGQYLAEMENSRLCFSPFGYGEICWRDIEAFQTGAVLLKPDMTHLETLPNLYEDGITYLSTRWDFSDLAQAVERALSEPDRLQAISREAFDRSARYLRSARFVDDVAFLFD